MFDVEGMKLLEILARVTIIYVACMVLLRLSGRREMSELGPMDLLTMLLLSETVSPALTGGLESVTGGLVAATILIGLSVLTSWLAFRSRTADRIIQGDAVMLSEANKIGQMSGAKILVSGSVIHVDKKIYLVARIVGTETSRILGVSVDGKASDELAPLVEKLAEAVAEKITREGDKLVAFFQ